MNVVALRATRLLTILRGCLFLSSFFEFCRLSFFLQPDYCLALGHFNFECFLSFRRQCRNVTRHFSCHAPIRYAHRRSKRAIIRELNVKGTQSNPSDSSKGVDIPLQANGENPKLAQGLGSPDHYVDSSHALSSAQSLCFDSCFDPQQTPCNLIQLPAPVE